MCNQASCCQACLVKRHDKDYLLVDVTRREGIALVIALSITVTGNNHGSL